MKVRATILSIVLGMLSVESAVAGLIDLPGLQSVRIWEATGGLFTHSFAASGPETTARLTTLSATSNDFATSAAEYVDVFYSNADGTFNLHGEYLTIEAVYTSNLGPGLNIVKAMLDFAVSPDEFATEIASFVSGPGYVAGSEANALAEMGRSGVGGPERLRLTLGFPSTNPGFVPAPATLVLFALGMVGMGYRRYKS
jgi:hypothetical protein